MYFNIIGVFLLIIILVAGLLLFYFNKKNMINICYVYSGPGLLGLEMSYKTKNPPLSFYNKDNEVFRIDSQGIRNQRYALFELKDTNEIVLVDFYKKYPPKSGEEVIVRLGDNYYLRKIEHAYNGYDQVEDYKFQIKGDNDDETKMIAYSEIIGNINYIAIK